MSEELCGQINFADENVIFDSASKKYTCKDKIFNAYCSSSENGEKGQCKSDEELLGSAFMALLKNFKSIDDEKSEGDKLLQYAILWLSYKIRQNPDIEFIRNTIYDILTQNEWFSEYRQYTDKNDNIMGFHFLFLTRLYALLKGICGTINKCNESSNSAECIKSGEECSDLYRACIVQIPWAEICNPYCSVLSNLKNDYDKLRKNNDQLPELTPPEGIKSCENFCEILRQRLNAKEWVTEFSEIGIFTKANLPGQPIAPTSINNGNRLPYIAVPFILIPIILGISYKYLTPVWRKKMKKKTMKKIINLSDQKKA
ncbi:Plasmodium variant antigen protein Cir/Yir/Bir, putative [Plasmodium chabaudi adami]|uniref:Plasmodium variant antigen protein Cir/Yir/Bir, putative n=1 Tax=Plasmodium chabaudi adami TaxID=5826 RepID=A0A1C6WTA2_PLACE|nr:Plasmodium variant antigen protein Cir/Yir/Bir, putative [Plasmodium chabaudi adami]